jgi:hypothetical protein
MSATVSYPNPGRWLGMLLRGQPHQIIRNSDAPYLHRWYLLPRNRRLNVYLHRFLASDDPIGLHDHPWWFCSLILRGWYYEVTATVTTVRRRGSIAVRRATHRHRVCLPRDANGREIPCLTIIITGPHVREWGFWCSRATAEPDHFIPWRDIDAGGCGDPDEEQLS